MRRILGVERGCVTLPFTALASRLILVRIKSEIQISAMKESEFAALPVDQ